MSRCLSGKRTFVTENLAREALIEAAIKFKNELNKGPVNYYLCNQCGDYHLTSQGEEHELFSDQELLDRMKTEKESRHWESRLRR
ncbi:MAG: hypothetical protein RJQ09_16035 [Cyclobacteriaceae bacterium]